MSRWTKNDLNYNLRCRIDVLVKRLPNATGHRRERILTELREMRFRLYTLEPRDA